MFTTIPDQLTELDQLFRGLSFPYTICTQLWVMKMIRDKIKYHEAYRSVLVNLVCHNKIPHISDLNHKNLILIVLKAGSLTSCWGLVRALVLACSQPPTQAPVSSPSSKGTNLIMGPPPSGYYLNLITSQKPHLQKPSHWRLGLQHINVEEVINIQSRIGRNVEAKDLRVLISGCNQPNYFLSLTKDT